VNAVPAPYAASRAEWLHPVHRHPDLRRDEPVARQKAILDPGLDLTLRPMRYPELYDRFRDAIRNTWTVEEVNLSDDLGDLAGRLLPSEMHLVRRLVAFFATGDSIVANNVVLNLYRHINAPEARLYLSRQLFEEAQHVQFYLTLLDTYISDPAERARAFAAIEHVPSIKAKAEFCFRWMSTIKDVGELRTASERRQFLLNLICFAACTEGLFFFAAFAYVYFLRSKGLLNALAAGTNWVFRDESGHIDFAFAVVDTVRREEPELFDDQLARQVAEMMTDAVQAETSFAADLLVEGVPGLSLEDTRRYLEYVADQRLARAGFAKRFGARNPFPFMQLQDVQEFANFFERTVSAYQVGVSGDVSFEEDF
jgi:ribonucleoside-diphosphate reductase beta chain